ncbi:MAG: superoxide dismutase family protein [Acidovorax sp.]
MTILRLPLAALGAAALVLAGCASTAANPTAVAQLEPTRGSTAAGSVRFVQAGNVVRVSGEVRGLAPNTEHGFHIHEKGDCSSGDGMSAGGHFNPSGQPHGHFGQGAHHAGDLPSLRADANGVARVSFETRVFTVGDGGAADIVGRGLIVHKDPDDYTTQPTGNSGARLACAVIKR